MVRLEEQPGLVRLSRDLQALLCQRLRRAQFTPDQVKRPKAKQHRTALRGIAELVTQRPGTGIVLFYLRRAPPLSDHQRRSHGQAQGEFLGCPLRRFWTRQEQV